MQKLKHNISIWLLSIFGYIMLSYWTGIILKDTRILTDISSNLWPGSLILSIFYTAFKLSFILFILLFIALIELGLKHYKNIGYDFDKPFINNPIIFFLFKLGFYLMFFPMMFLITVLFIGISFIPVQYNFIGWFLPAFLTTGLIFVNIPIKSNFIKFIFICIFVFYALIITCLNFVK